MLRITFYIIQRTFEIMHNLCPNPRNYLGRSFNHILKYLQTSSLPNLPNCDTTYNCHISSLSVSICLFKCINVYYIKPYLITIAYATSSCSYTIGVSCTTAIIQLSSIFLNSHFALHRAFVVPSYDGSFS